MVLGPVPHGRAMLCWDGAYALMDVATCHGYGTPLARTWLGLPVPVPPQRPHLALLLPYCLRSSFSPLLCIFCSMTHPCP